MELITLKEASRITSLSYSHLFRNKSNLGFIQVQNKGKWLVDKKTLEEKIKGVNNSDRLTSAEEVITCQSKKGVKPITLTFSRQMDQELDDLLARKTKSKHSNTTTR